MCFRSGSIFSGDTLPISDDTLIQPPAAVGPLFGNPAAVAANPAGTPPATPFSLLCGSDGAAAPLLSSLTFLVDNGTRGIQVGTVLRASWACIWGHRKFWFA